MEYVAMPGASFPALAVMRPGPRIERMSQVRCRTRLRAGVMIAMVSVPWSAYEKRGRALLPRRGKHRIDRIVDGHDAQHLLRLGIDHGHSQQVVLGHQIGHVLLWCERVDGHRCVGEISDVGHLPIRGHHKVTQPDDVLQVVGVIQDVDVVHRLVLLGILGPPQMVDGLRGTEAGGTRANSVVMMPPAASSG